MGGCLKLDMCGCVEDVWMGGWVDGCIVCVVCMCECVKVGMCACVAELSSGPRRPLGGRGIRERRRRRRRRRCVLVKRQFGGSGSPGGGNRHRAWTHGPPIKTPPLPQPKAQ